MGSVKITELVRPTARKKLARLHDAVQKLVEVPELCDCLITPTLSGNEWCYTEVNEGQIATGWIPWSQLSRVKRWCAVLGVSVHVGGIADERPARVTVRNGKKVEIPARVASVYLILTWQERRT